MTHLGQCALRLDGFEDVAVDLVAAELVNQTVRIERREDLGLDASESQRHFKGLRELV
jgi:hypothetical protein